MSSGGSNWIVNTEPASKRRYYFNTATGQTSWDEPPEVSRARDEGHEVHVDPSTGWKYFYDEEAGENVWLPKELDSKRPADRGAGGGGNAAGRYDGAGQSAAQPKADDQSKRTLCRHFMQFGVCQYGDRCSFAHGEAELIRGPVVPAPTSSTVNRPAPVAAQVKTKLCTRFMASSTCPFGVRCPFAHGLNELCDDPKRAPKIKGPPVLPGEVNPHDPACKYFKTRMCGSYYDVGVCVLGKRCGYAHGQDELRADPDIGMTWADYCSDMEMQRQGDERLSEKDARAKDAREKANPERLPPGLGIGAAEAETPAKRHCAEAE